MLNDVHAPPLDPDGKRTAQARSPVHRTLGGNLPADRAHVLERAADHHGGNELVFTEPEDRGASFNTAMSAIIVGSVLAVIALVGWWLMR